jgi:phosphoserine phosphatase
MANSDSQDVVQSSNPASNPHAACRDRRDCVPPRQGLIQSASGEQPVHLEPAHSVAGVSSRSPPEGHPLTPCSQCTARVTLRGRVERLIVARHAESVYNVQALISADPSSHRSPLTSRGIHQARSLADRLAEDEIELCVASGTLRAVQTAEIVTRSHSTLLMKTPLLDDPPAGVFEDGPVEAFVRWMSVCDADTPVPGTSMSLRDSARRYFEAARLLLRRPERTILVVAHAPALRWIVQAAQGRSAPLDYRHPLFTHADPVDVDVFG